MPFLDVLGFGLPGFRIASGIGSNDGSSTVPIATNLNLHF